MKLILIFLITMTSAFAANPSSRNCEYYKTVEASYQCGSSGYPLQFGHRLCQKYLKAEPSMSKAVKRWFPKIRLCLQQYIERNHGSFRSCGDLHQRAIDSHVNCYLKTGFCDLSWADSIQILKVTSTDILNTDIIALSAKVNFACANR
jgi:hypothetical protein